MIGHSNMACIQCNKLAVEMTDNLAVAFKNGCDADPRAAFARQHARE